MKRCRNWQGEYIQGAKLSNVIGDQSNVLWHHSSYLIATPHKLLRSRPIQAIDTKQRCQIASKAEVEFEERMF